MGTFYLKRNDTRPVLEVALLNPDGTAFDLTGATTTRLHVRLQGGGVFVRDMTVYGVATAGILRYTWLAADWTTLVPGAHQMEYEVLTGTARITFPNDSYDTLRIPGDLGG